MLDNAEKIHQLSMQIMEKTGMLFHHPDACGPRRPQELFGPAVGLAPDLRPDRGKETGPGGGLCKAGEVV